MIFNKDNKQEQIIIVKHEFVYEEKEFRVALNLVENKKDKNCSKENANQMLRALNNLFETIKDYRNNL